jgi:nitrite reductase/ring-hydroxylating ferredoxin subunit
MAAGQSAAAWLAGARVEGLVDRQIPEEALPDGWAWREVCASAALADGGDGVRFEVPGRDQPLAAFAVRSAGVVRGYLNQCRHIPVELDWQPGRFFDDTGLYLICATHGATYRASDGRCAGGPCNGQGLIALQVLESDGAIWVAVQDGNA